jgi:uncharacterized protein involved in tolerance to divalent cations
MSDYLYVQISAETEAQASSIMDLLLSKKLVTGGQFLRAPARFLWKGKIVNMDYYMITSYTMLKHKKAIISAVKEISIEEVPMITFTPFDGNAELLQWVVNTVA